MTRSPDLSSIAMSAVSGPSSALLDRSTVLVSSSPRIVRRPIALTAIAKTTMHLTGISHSSKVRSWQNPPCHFAGNAQRLGLIPVAIRASSILLGRYFLPRQLTSMVLPNSSMSIPVVERSTVPSCLHEQSPLGPSTCATTTFYRCDFSILPNAQWEAVLRTYDCQADSACSHICEI